MRILVPTAMLPSDELALRYAIYFHESLGARVTLLHAEEMPLDPRRTFGEFLDNSADARRDAAIRLRDYARAHAGLSVHVETIVIDDAPAHAIVETAERLDADLIIMRNGAITDGVLRTSKRPVMTVTPRLFETRRGIGIHTILTPTARLAVEHANAFGKLLGAKVVVVDEPPARILDIAAGTGADLIVTGGTSERVARYARQPVLRVMRPPKVVSMRPAATEAPALPSRP